MLILASMSWFLTNAWDNGTAIMGISGLFAAIYLISGRHLWLKQGLRTPGGLPIAATAGLTPVFIYGLQKMLLFNPLHF